MIPKGARCDNPQTKETLTGPTIMIWILQKSPISMTKRCRTGPPNMEDSHLVGPISPPVMLHGNRWPGFWPSEIMLLSLYHCNCICFFQMQLCHYRAYPNLSRSWSTCWGLWLKINVSWNMLDNVRPTPHVRPPGGGSLSLLIRRIVATADWNAGAWSEKTMNKQQINGSRFRWRAKRLCLIDLNSKHSSISVYLLSSNSFV